MVVVTEYENVKTLQRGFYSNPYGNGITSINVNPVDIKKAAIDCSIVYKNGANAYQYCKWWLKSPTIMEIFRMNGYTSYSIPAVGCWNVIEFE